MSLFCLESLPVFTRFPPFSMSTRRSSVGRSSVGRLGVMLLFCGTGMLFSSLLATAHASGHASGLPAAPTSEEFAVRDQFVAAAFDGETKVPLPAVEIEVVADDSGIRHGTSGHSLRRNQMWDDRPMKIGGMQYHSGLSIHANASLVVRLPGPGAKFSAVVGVDSSATTPQQGSAVFSVTVGDKQVYESPVLRGGKSGQAAAVEVPLGGVSEFVLKVADAGDGIAYDVGNWADARVTLEDGRVLRLGGSLTGRFEAVPPFSFTYGGVRSTELLSGWKRSMVSRPLDAERTEQVQTYTDPATGLEVRCVAIVYHDYPTVEWTVYFTNKGEQPTPLLSDIEGIDVLLERGETGEFVLHYQQGSTATPDEYQPLTQELPPGSQKQLSPAGGRASGEYLPYFNVSWHGAGAIVVLGWPGQWAADFRRQDERGLRVVGGQELTHLKLAPGEQVRTPLSVLQFYRGDVDRAQNIWRRWMVAHNLPRPAGKLPRPILSASSAPQLAEMMMANEQNQFDFVDRYLDAGLDIDYWWMDFGWYYYKGNDMRYEADLSRFPRGLRSITDHAHARGVGSIVWFEPETRFPAHRVVQQHPDWLLGEAHGILNLGLPEVRQWVTNQVHGQLQKEGIDVFRSDYNVEPLVHWRGNDTPDRQGITENHYVTGYLEFWDELRRRNPALLIDSCSSGGKRNDLETMRRAVPLWRSDYNNIGYVVFNYIIAPRKELASTLQNHTYGLARWLPYFGVAARDVDQYIFRSGMCPALVCGWDVRRDDLDYELMRKMVTQWREVADYYLGDYYPLMPYSLSREVWCAWQFDRPELAGGVVQAFRRAECSLDRAVLKLRGLEPTGVYRVTDLDQQESYTVSGQSLMGEGLRVTIETQPGARIIKYQRLEDSAQGAQ